jgi:hypothetical protein
MQLHAWTLAALATLAPAFISGADVPRFAPAEGSSVTRTISLTSHLASTSAKIEVDGEEQESGDAAGAITIDDSSRIVVADEFVKMGKARPAELHRTFETLEGKNKQAFRDAPEGSEREKEQASVLADKTVVFKWNEKDETYDRSFGESKGDDDVLASLDEDMDFRAFLPEPDVKEDASWTVKGKTAAAFLFPGGDLKLEDTEKGDDWEDHSALDRHLRENLKGSIEVTYKGTREEDGQKVGVLALKGDVESAGEMTGKDDAKTNVSFTANLKGEILWDLAAKRVSSAAVTLDQKVIYKDERSMEFGGDHHSIKQEIGLEGPVKFELKTGK